jgi:hypothetical protein
VSGVDELGERPRLVVTTPRTPIFLFLCKSPFLRFQFSCDFSRNSNRLSTARSPRIFGKQKNNPSLKSRLKRPPVTVRHFDNETKEYWINGKLKKFSPRSPSDYSSIPWYEPPGLAGMRPELRVEFLRHYTREHSVAGSTDLQILSIHVVLSFNRDS